ncbi:conserved hypothetical protein [Ricinus communis]|uniref:DUF4283 domain-containing protein n=1 Tax=Ricinus communis TaxID=3988 RepID=B9RWX0_RICCO|nr:conserved hypothetical protein [Ricinus communis]
MASASNMEASYDMFSIADEEEGGLVLEGEVLEVEQVDYRWCLVGRVLTDKQVDFTAMKNMMASLWRPVYFHELDFSRVIANGPWSFENKILLIHRLRENDQPCKTQLHHADICIQRWKTIKSAWRKVVALRSSDEVGRKGAGDAIAMDLQEQVDSWQ